MTATFRPEGQLFRCPAAYLATTAADAERICGLIVHKSEFTRLLDEEIAGLGSFQNFRC